MKKAYPDVPETPIPKCTGKKLGSILAKKGMTKDSRVHLNLDPGFAFATDGLSYNVLMSEPDKHFYVNIDDCSIIKEM